jgi:hypothetical protein
MPTAELLKLPRRRIPQPRRRLPSAALSAARPTNASAMRQARPARTARTAQLPA